MNRLILAAMAVSVMGVILLVPLLSGQQVEAGTVKKIQFTQTLTSSEDPGIGHGGEQLAMVLSPNNGTLYDGTLTYTASAPVQIVIFHKIGKGDSRGQPVWTVDNSTIYAETTIDSNSSGGTLNFAGSAIGIHSTNSSQFTATVTIDGWIRGTSPTFLQNANTPAPAYVLRLSRSEVPVDIPLHKGFYDGKPLYYIITDSSDSQDASLLSSKQGWKIQTSALLAQSPQKLLNRVYVFTNGMPGNGTLGFQDEVFSSIPSSQDYVPLALVTHARWIDGTARQVLNSTKEILDANQTGKLVLTNTGTVMNMPQIVWPGGQMEVRDGSELSDTASYAGGQVIGIDNSTYKFVTFLAHRGWGPDGKTVYYIVTGATPQGPAGIMGLPNMPSLPSLSTSSRDLYHFTNGIKGAGPFGFQEGISAAQPGDTSYSPVCKVSIVTWHDGKNATLLETVDDINYEKSQGMLTVQPGLVYDKSYMLDCPIIELPKTP